MGQYLLRRLVLLIPTVVGMSIIIFLMVRLMPGDIVDAMVGQDPNYTPEAKAEVRKSFGLDDPIYVQYGRWAGAALRGDLGESYRTKQPITKMLLQSLPITLELTFLAIIMSVVVAVPLGVISAVKRNSQTDFWARIGGLIGLSFPNFWLATMLLLFTSMTFKWVPPLEFIPPTQNLLGNLQQMFMPALALAVPLMAVEMRMARASMLEVMRQDYIRTARAKGLRSNRVVYHHALRNALIPVITVIGIQVGVLMGGSVIIEQIFGLPGVGWFLLQGIFGRDYPVIQVTTLFLATVFVVLNLVVDLTYGFIDPRIHYS